MSDSGNLPAEVFADTSALYAALDESDRAHTSAAPLLDSMLREDVRLVTTSYVILESASLLQRRTGRRAARRFLLDLVPALDVAWVESGLHMRGVEAWLAGGRDLSLVDCVSFALMHELHIEVAFAFDSHFEEQGFRLLS